MQPSLNTKQFDTSTFSFIRVEKIGSLWPTFVSNYDQTELNDYKEFTQFKSF